MRRAAVGLALLTIATVFGGCGNADAGITDTLRAAIRATEAQPRRFTYADTVPGKTSQVQGIVEDDGRYKATLSVNSRPTLDEVVTDDTLVDRFQDPNAVDLFLRPQTKPTDTTTALRARQWVLDPAGAPELAATTAQKRVQGQDPVYDSLTVLRYLAKSVDEQLFKEFNPHDLEYDPREDHFPRPRDGGSIKRYDSIRPPLPKPAQTSGASGRQVLPALQHFRKMSIYVNKGRVVQVMDEVDVQSRITELLKMNDLPIPKDVPASQVADALTDVINKLRKGQGDEPIRVRKMEARFSDIGANIRVTLPTETVTGNLSVLRDRGRVTPVATPAA
jgi:hypothetical protein